MRESIIQSQITKYLTAQGWLVVKIMQTNRNGWPDLQAHRDGVTVFIECKQPGEKARPLQKYIHKLLWAQGFFVIPEATSVEYVQLKFQQLLIK